MKLSRWSYQDRAVGRVVVVFLVLGGLMMGVRQVPVAEALGTRTRPVTLRQQLVTKLQELGGRHLVIVRYGPTHVFHREWVINRASIDDSEIVWLRASALSQASEVFAYFQNRQAWLVDVEQKTARVYKYGPSFEGGTPGSEQWVLSR